MMQHVIDVDEVVEVDYLVGDDPYKKDWMNHRRERWGIVAYNPSTFLGVVGIVRQVLGILYKKWRCMSHTH
jgi:CelD/BcsL family acetyltransferase involved in cellulose biosynthesis